MDEFHDLLASESDAQAPVDEEAASDEEGAGAQASSVEHVVHAQDTAASTNVYATTNLPALATPLLSFSPNSEAKEVQVVWRKQWEQLQPFSFVGGMPALSTLMGPELVTASSLRLSPQFFLTCVQNCQLLLLHAPVDDPAVQSLCAAAQLVSSSDPLPDGLLKRTHELAALPSPAWLTKQEAGGQYGSKYRPALQEVHRQQSLARAAEEALLRTLTPEEEGGGRPLTSHLQAYAAVSVEVPEEHNCCVRYATVEQVGALCAWCGSLWAGYHASIETYAYDYAVGADVAANVAAAWNQQRVAQDRLLLQRRQAQDVAAFQQAHSGLSSDLFSLTAPFLHLEAVVAHPAAPGTGTQVLQKLCAVADELEMGVLLEAVAEGLVGALYAKLGFRVILPKGGLPEKKKFESVGLLTMWRAATVKKQKASAASSIVGAAIAAALPSMTDTYIGTVDRSKHASGIQSGTETARRKFRAWSTRPALKLQETHLSDEVLARFLEQCVFVAARHGGKRKAGQRVVRTEAVRPGETVLADLVYIPCASWAQVYRRQMQGSVWPDPPYALPPTVPHRLYTPEAQEAAEVARRTAEAERAAAAEAVRRDEERQRREERERRRQQEQQQRQQQQQQQQQHLEAEEERPLFEAGASASTSVTGSPARKVRAMLELMGSPFRRLLSQTGTGGLQIHTGSGGELVRGSSSGVGQSNEGKTTVHIHLAPVIHVHF